jgi:hypothetical protein
MLDWIAISVLLTIAIALLAPQQLGVTLYKLSLVALAAVAGYRIDRSLFPYARPDDLSLSPGIETAAAQLRRAIVVAACIIGVSLGA